VHRDVKPANIVIEQGAEDDQDHVYVTDFGITKRLLSQTGLTATGEFVGTIDYIAPEQIQGKRVDARADIYSLACILYQCLTGRVPFEDNLDAAALWAHLQDQPAAPSTLRPELGCGIDEVLRRALSKRPEERYPTCRDLITASRGALEAGANTPQSFEFDDPPADPLSTGPREQPQGILISDARDQPASDPLSAGERDRPGPLLRGSSVTPARPKRTRPPAPPRRTRPPDRIRATDRGIRRRLVGGGVVAILVIAAVLAAMTLSGGGGSGRGAAGTAGGLTGASNAAGGASAGMSGSGPSSSKPASGGKAMPANKMSAGNAISEALRVTNESRTAKGLLPPASCSAQGKSAVTCMRPAFGATSVTFRTYPSLDALYGAYLAAIRAVAPGSYHSDFGDCTEQQTDGEVSWNHNYEHPRHFSLAQSRSGRLTDDQAAGRVFCTFSNSMLHIVWTQHDGRLLGVLNGAPHANTWDWWKGVHHSIDLPGSNSSMSMS
jgi:Protein kinase domain